MFQPTLIIYPNPKKISIKTGLIPLYARVIFKGRKKETRIHYELDKYEFNAWNKRAFLVELKNSPANLVITKFVDLFNHLILENQEYIGNWNAQDIVKRLSGRAKATHVTILEYFDKYYSDNIYGNPALSQGTKQNYLKAHRHFQNFITKFKLEKVTIGGFEKSDADNLLLYLMKSDPSSNKKTMAPYTATQLIKKYKTVFIQAKEDGLIMVNPMNHLKIIGEYEQKTPLNRNEIIKLINFDTHNRPDLEKAKDYFLFMFYTGFSYSDCMGLKIENLILLDHDLTMVEGQRRKTKETFKFILLKQALEIISKYSDQKLHNRIEYVLPYISDQHFNRLLHSIGDRMGISNKLTSHIARHSINQFIEDEGLSDVDAIYSMMGWGRKRSIKNNYSRISNLRMINFHWELQEKINLLTGIETEKSNEGCIPVQIQELRMRVLR